MEELDENAEILMKQLIREYFDKHPKNKELQLTAIRAMELAHFYDEAEEMKSDYQLTHN